jgi:hypothetical protein
MITNRRTQAPLPVFLAALLTLSSIPATAQHRQQRLHTGINFVTGLAAKTKIEGEGKTRYGFTSAPQIFFEGTLNLYGRLSDNYWLALGLGGGVVAYNFDTYLPGNTFNPPVSNIYSNGPFSREMDLLYLKVPLEVERRWITRKGNLWNANAGISLLYAPPMDVSLSGEAMHNGSLHEYMEIEQNNDNHGNPWLNYHLAGGYSWKLRWGHLLRVNMKLSLSFTEYGSATYRASVPDHPVAEGRYGVTGSYLGVSVGYLFGRR